MSGAVRDYHLESRVSNENYILELAIGELVGLGVGRQEILEHVGETLDGIEDAATREVAS